jgi:hypothetical protein
MLEKPQSVTPKLGTSVFVLIKSSGVAELIEPPLAGMISLDGEDFMLDPSVQDWIGFYDWLRTSDGQVIGICLRPDEGTLDEATLKFLVALDEQNSVSDLRIFFANGHEFDPVLSDDGDFGGNKLMRGTAGSLVLAFNAPADRTTRQGITAA